mmetsp:Transcript_9957/g.27839  ORF Transcript_9957/g.27839 Transcript_9957/m.27839 type:complete len:94 (-) Transcript_9957:145-426(-)
MQVAKKKWVFSQVRHNRGCTTCNTFQTGLRILIIMQPLTAFTVRILSFSPIADEGFSWFHFATAVSSAESRVTTWRCPNESLATVMPIDTPSS